MARNWYNTAIFCFKKEREIVKLGTLQRKWSSRKEVKKGRELRQGLAGRRLLILASTGGGHDVSISLGIRLIPVKGNRTRWAWVGRSVLVLSQIGPLASQVSHVFSLLPWLPPTFAVQGAGRTMREVRDLCKAHGYWEKQRKLWWLGWACRRCDPMRLKWFKVGGHVVMSGGCGCGLALDWSSRIFVLYSLSFFHFGPPY